MYLIGTNTITTNPISMKKVRLFLAALAALCLFQLSDLHAQGKSGAFGVRAGLQTAQLKGDLDDLFNNNQNRYFVGIFKESWVVPLLRFHMGLEYYETGSRDNGVDLKLGYLSVPVALKADIGLFNVYGGISGAYRLFAHEEVNGDRLEVPGDKYERLDYSTFVGGGINILFIGVDIRHHWGRREVIDGYKNRFWQVGATLRF